MRERCALCRRKTRLLRSHIISNFALRDARGNKGEKLLEVSSAARARLPRDQAWDQERLLCGHCEDRRREWEAIVAATVAGRGDKRERRPSAFFDAEFPEKWVHVRHLRYGPVKLWLLSTVFLMHHAQKRAWAHVSLTVDEEHRLRARVQSGDPGSDLDFQIFGRITTRSPALAEEAPGGVIIPGYITEGSSGKVRTRFVNFYALDCQWCVLLGDWPDNPIREARLRIDGAWRVLRDEDYQEMVRTALAMGLVF